jgi:hypothetical protein
LSHPPNRGEPASPKRADVRFAHKDARELRKESARLAAISTYASLPMEHGFIAARRIDGLPLVQLFASTSRSRYGAPPRGNVDPLLAGQISANYIPGVPTIDLPADELAAVAAAIRGLIEGDRYPHAPRLDPLRAALARLEAAAATNVEPADETPKNIKDAKPQSATNVAPTSKPIRPPKAPPPAKADKRARR